MNSKQMTTRLGVLVAGSAAIFSLGMTAPATARPADGSVGHVPTKVPAGQAADGEGDGEGDGNRGWECDGNNGVGQGNPAHGNDCGATSSVTPPADTTVDFN